MTSSQSPGPGGCSALLQCPWAMRNSSAKQAPGPAAQGSASSREGSRRAPDSRAGGSGGRWEPGPASLRSLHPSVPAVLSAGPPIPPTDALRPCSWLKPGWGAPVGCGGEWVGDGTLASQPGMGRLPGRKCHGAGAVELMSSEATGRTRKACGSQASASLWPGKASV